MSSEESMDRHPSRLAPTGRRRLWLVSVPLAVVLLLVTWLLAFGLGRDPNSYRNPLVGHRAPSFHLESADGTGSVDLRQLRGQVVVVNFWASWCNDCVAEHAALNAAWRRYRDQGVVVLGVVYQDTGANAERFMRDLGGDWPQVEDPGSRTALAYGVRGVPETFFISRSGRVAAQHSGAVTYELLARRISRLLGGSR
jgi:cytochrome c biogenesis protein CcmG/thiol:disulfide interchange protein DsbE